HASGPRALSLHDALPILAAGHLDLHSQRSQVDLELLAELARAQGQVAIANSIEVANSALHALELATEAGLPLGSLVADRPRETTIEVLGEEPEDAYVVVTDRSGHIVGRAPST